MQSDEPLPPPARATLEALLAGADPALRAQVPYARVAGRCGCGCVTVDLAVDRTAVAPAPAAGNPVADGWYAAPEGTGVMVFARDGYLSLLEAYGIDGPVTAWPEPRFLERG
ncbi:hypothetical protein [Streptomyces luteireticuli]|uniref:DUF779 domain-containing protein n=1 Tax=Streptomyces luteireticuli TaxID=173858 RepID=A0ABP3I6L7_9ACTN